MSDHVFFFWKVHMPHLHSSADGSMLPFLFFLLCIFNISINVINNLEKASENLEMQHSKCEMQYSNCWNGIDKLLDFKNYFKNIHIRYHCVALTPKKQLGANDFEIDAWFKKKIIWVMSFVWIPPISSMQIRTHALQQKVCSYMALHPVAASLLHRGLGHPMFLHESQTMKDL